MVSFEYDMGAAFGMLEGLELSLNEIHGVEGEKVLKRAGFYVASLLKKAVPKFEHVDTGELGKSIRPTKAKESKGGGRYVDVYPHDSRKRGGHKTRNAEIGFYLEHGVTRVPPGQSIPASHWMSNTIDDHENEILDIMETAINEVLNKNIGGE